MLILATISINAQTTVETWVIDANANGISDNGEIICGYDGNTGQAFYWTLGTGKVLLGTSEAFAVSNDTTVVGRFLDPNTLTNGNPTWVAAYYKNGQWTKLSGIPGIDPLDEQSYTHAYSINGDGNKITGMAWEPGYIVEACYWVLPDTGIGLLGRTNNGNSRADDISNDGSVIVGWNGGLNNNPDRTPYYWDPTPHFMGSLDSTWDGGECNGVSPDGHYLVGNTSAWSYVYTQSEGMQMIVDQNNGWWNSWCSDVSNNEIVVGHCDLGFFDYRATIWKPGWNDVALVYNYLIDTLGVTGIDDWFPLFNRAISADGTIFCGEMADNSHPFGGVTFVVKITTTVPVEFTTFTAASSGNDIRLNWSTATETNNSGFNIERKLNNSDWQSVGFVPGFGTTTDQHSYSFTDKNLSAGSYSYRLKQTDFDGSFKYSEIVNAEIGSPVEYTLSQNYPNPFNPSTKIDFSVPGNEVVNIIVYNSLGQEVAVLMNKELTAGHYSVNFDAKGLASGIYIAKMTAGNFVGIKKMNLLK
jgi:Secretion system C-terminal sorting domain